MIHATNTAATPRRVIAERQRVRVETMKNPDMDRLTDISLLADLIPEGWDEKVFEYSDKWFINLTIDKAISRPEEFYMANLIAKELGFENLILPNVTENTDIKSIINIQLKKPNYKEEVFA